MCPKCDFKDTQLYHSSVSLCLLVILTLQVISAKLTGRIEVFGIINHLQVLEADSR